MLTTTAIEAATTWCGHSGWGIGPFFLLIPLFWIVVIALVFAFAGRRWRAARFGAYGPGYQRAPWASSGTRAAERTLAERYARGDIDEAEYRARLEVLRANRPDES